MLEDSLFESQGRKKTRKPVTVVVSAIAHVVTIVVLVLIPLIQTHALTVPSVDMSLWAPTIESLRVVSGHPLLNQAALDAVRQWRYRPTMLNSEPVEVITTVTVTFTLQ